MYRNLLLIFRRRPLHLYLVLVIICISIALHLLLCICLCLYHQNIIVDGGSDSRVPAMQEIQVRSLGQEDPPRNEKATLSSILAWRIPWTEKPGRLLS